MAKQKKEGAMSVQTNDVLSQAVSAALARVNEMKGKTGLTLIDTISDEDWAKWDGSGEKALVSDPCGLDDYDHLDDDVAPPKAA